MLVVVPVVALASWAIHPAVSLAFRPVELATIGGGCLLVAKVVQDGKGQRREGVRRKLVGVDIEGDPLVPEATEFWPIIEDGNQIGHVTVAVYSPRLEKNVGYAWLPIERANEGSAVTISTEYGEARMGRVTSIPFVDPAKAIPRA